MHRSQVFNNVMQITDSTNKPSLNSPWPQVQLLNIIFVKLVYVGLNLSKHFWLYYPLKKVTISCFIIYFQSVFYEHHYLYEKHNLFAKTLHVLAENFSRFLNIGTFLDFHFSNYNASVLFPASYQQYLWHLYRPICFFTNWPYWYIFQIYIYFFFDSIFIKISPKINRTHQVSEIFLHWDEYKCCFWLFSIRTKKKHFKSSIVYCTDLFSA